MLVKSKAPEETQLCLLLMTRCTSVAGRPLSRGSSEPSAVYCAMVAPLHKSADFVFHQKEPPNGGPPLCRLVEEFVTNAVWRGCLLADLLHFIGCVGRAKHIEFIGSDSCQKEGTETKFGGSIPLARALAGDVLLAWGMNGRPLSREHGAPLRAI